MVMVSAWFGWKLKGWCDRCAGARRQAKAQSEPEPDLEIFVTETGQKNGIYHTQRACHHVRGLEPFELCTRCQQIISKNAKATKTKMIMKK